METDSCGTKVSSNGFTAFISFFAGIPVLMKKLFHSCFSHGRI